MDDVSRTNKDVGVAPKPARLVAALCTMVRHCLLDAQEKRAAICNGVLSSNPLCVVKRARKRPQSGGGICGSATALQWKTGPRLSIGLLSAHDLLGLGTRVDAEGGALQSGHGR